MGLAHVIRDLASCGKETELVLRGATSVQSRVTHSVFRKNIFFVCRMDSGEGCRRRGDDFRGTAAIQARDGGWGGGGVGAVCRSGRRLPGGAHRDPHPRGRKDAAIIRSKTFRVKKNLFQILIWLLSYLVR